MSLRALFLLLLFANLAFFGWADLIDVPPEPPQSDGISQLPQLKLLSEVRGSSPPPQTSAASQSSTIPGSAAVAPGSSAASGEGPSSAASAASGGALPGSAARADGAASSAGVATSGGAAPSRGGRDSGGASSSSAAPAGGPGRMGSNDPGAGSTGAVGTGIMGTGVARTGAVDGTGHRCITVGPFADPARARDAADLLRERGFEPRPRDAAAGAPQGYWVFVAGLKSSSDEENVLRRLMRNGISDAKAMPASDTDRRVSVGLFNARDGAERRARAVRRLGFDAQVAPRSAAVAHWVDVNLDSSSQSLPAEGLLSLEEAGSRLEIKECPPIAVGGQPGATLHRSGSRPGQAGSEAGSKGVPPARTKPPRSGPDYRPVVPRPLTAEGRPRPG